MHHFIFVFASPIKITSSQSIIGKSDSEAKTGCTVACIGSCDLVERYCTTKPHNKKLLMVNSINMQRKHIKESVMNKLMALPSNLGGGLTGALKEIFSSWRGDCYMVGKETYEFLLVVAKLWLCVQWRGA